ncbi:hypothetical protein [Actinorugispora endophytica]|uniref:Uncharacterized protein n=1 Tax=Actinorugispora endophytica TaxID=1605990 RepID=A0A4R6USM9_9ACTN|nr:hypothetical protein [Actinorugispora endophytica]TDQ50298.1 hypothetical protein EV190_11367 [Actinorugispora endophytica]
MAYAACLVVGMAALVLGAQGGIRLLVDHGDAGVLQQVPGGFAVWLACYAAMAVLGAALAGWGAKRAGLGGRAE